MGLLSDLGAVDRLTVAVNNLCHVIGSSVHGVTKTDLEEMEKRIMSKISDYGAAAQAAFDKISSDLDAISTAIAA